MKNILIACEESQTIANIFRDKGYNAFSADLQECSGGRPEYHIKGDCLPLLDGDCSFTTQDGNSHSVEGRWDLIIAHPPCTYLTVTGNCWFNAKGYTTLYRTNPAEAQAKADKRKKLREEAIDFFMKFTQCNCERIAIENPVGVMGTRYRKADQTIQPYQFGDKAEKLTCLWLKGLPKLTPTNEVEPPTRVVFASGKSMPQWYSKAASLPPSERSKVRSRTFKGIAEAIVEQWSKII